MPQDHKPGLRRLRLRTAHLRRRLAALDFVASGTLHSRSRPCGKPNCRCAKDPAAWHGPYHDWTRRKDGRLIHNAVTEAQARLIRRAINNRRAIDGLLAQWEAETAREILGPERVTD